VHAGAREPRPRAYGGVVVVDAGVLLDRVELVVDPAPVLVVGVLVVGFAVDAVLGVLCDCVVLDRLVVVDLLGAACPPPRVLGVVGAWVLELVLLDRPDLAELTIATATAAPAISATISASRMIHGRPPEGRGGGIG
jgi:hypothetical protein